MTKTKHVTVHRDHLEVIESHECRGAYDYPREMTLYRVTAGPLADRIVLADHGFAWRENNGGYRESWSLLPEGLDHSFAADCIREGDLTTAQYDLYGDDSGWVLAAPVVHVRD